MHLSVARAPCLRKPPRYAATHVGTIWHAVTWPSFIRNGLGRLARFTRVIFPHRDGIAERKNASWSISPSALRHPLKRFVARSAGSAWIIYTHRQHPAAGWTRERERGRGARHRSIRRCGLRRFNGASISKSFRIRIRAPWLSSSRLSWPRLFSLWSSATCNYGARACTRDEMAWRNSDEVNSRTWPFRYYYRELSAMAVPLVISRRASGTRN